MNTQAIFLDTVWGVADELKELQQTVKSLRKRLDAAVEEYLETKDLDEDEVT